MHQIKKETIEHICILAQLDLSEEEKRQVEKDMEKMLAMMEQIKEVDTRGIEPCTHLFEAMQELREDEVIEKNGQPEALFNAPFQKNNMFQVPKTVG